ncbi:MAG: flagellar biosynthesis anti-sigma factor FlgM [Halieaceae bacterium]|jgi:negative regulator of flagellin synthesis FlgM|nr:flagellar biosynthesis anti-sigma factor FlgM [Halieaceae bacterium]
MSIRIPGADLNQGSQKAGRAAARSSDSATQGTSAAGAGDDTITLTNTAAELKKLEQSLAMIPDIDHARVATIKAAIAEGDYQVDADKIVSNLLDVERGIS